MTIKKSKKKTKVKKGNKYMCKECGLIVTIDENCDCYDVCDLICCGEQMVRKVGKSKKKTRRKKK